jgi:hypothetical protein
MKKGQLVKNLFWRSNLGLTKKVNFLKQRLVVTFRNSFAEKLGSLFDK